PVQCCLLLALWGLRVQPCGEHQQYSDLHKSRLALPMNASDYRLLIRFRRAFENLWRQTKSTVLDLHPQDAGGNVTKMRFMCTFGVATAATGWAVKSRMLQA